MPSMMCRWGTADSKLQGFLVCAKTRWEIAGMTKMLEQEIQGTGRGRWDR